MKRRIGKLAVFMLLGAIVSVGIASAVAAWSLSVAWPPRGLWGPLEGFDCSQAHVAELLKLRVPKRHVVAKAKAGGQRGPGLQIVHLSYYPPPNDPPDWWTHEVRVRAGWPLHCTEGWSVTTNGRAKSAT